MHHDRLADWSGLIRAGNLHQATMAHAPRTLSDWNARRDSEGLTALRFLIVERERSTREIFREALLTYAIRNLQEADTEQVALSCLARAHVDVILVGMGRGAAQGIEVARAARSDSRTANPDAAIIGISPDPFVYREAEAYAAGIDETVTSPLAPRDLIDTIRRTMAFVRR